MNVYLKSGGHIASVDRIYEIYKKYLADMSVYPHQFYLHTDAHAMEYINTQLNGTDIKNVSVDQRDQVLKILLDPRAIGCGHIRLMLQHPDLYDCPKNLTEAFLKAFYLYLWEEQGDQVAVDTSDLEILEGSHKELAVLRILEANLSDPLFKTTAPRCIHMAPLIVPLQNENSVFVFHADAIRYVRWNYAVFFAQEVGPENSPEVLFHEANILGEKQLVVTLGYLAPTQGIYTAHVIHETIRDFPWIVAGAVLGFLIVVAIGFIVWCHIRHNRKKDPAPLVPQVRLLD